MGISKVTGIAGTAFLVTSVSLCEMGMRITMLPFLGISFVAFVVTIASHNSINLPWILGKSSVGRFPLWSVVLFGLFLMLSRAYAMVKRYMRNESVYDKIVEGLYLGGWPFLLKHLPPGSPSVIDCTCELPRSSFVPADEFPKGKLPETLPVLKLPSFPSSLLYLRYLLASKVSLPSHFSLAPKLKVSYTACVYQKAENWL
ncbi:hypothetical protein HU200_030287 [Digitaria exilis]|uniref:Uncharacterized protein n=1 Tax=Digitaria exilis TaxID=1010633 RepID=A0A835ENI5_9POAL|nr:hypothetical protein HU200_030287 [Digitaria exilis]